MLNIHSVCRLDVGAPCSVKATSFERSGMCAGSPGGTAVRLQQPSLPHPGRLWCALPPNMLVLCAFARRSAMWVLLVLFAKTQRVPKDQLCKTWVSQWNAMFLHLCSYPILCHTCPTPPHCAALCCRCVVSAHIASVSAGVDYGSRNVLADPDLRTGIKEFSSWPTVPQVDHAAVQ